MNYGYGMNNYLRSSGNMAPAFPSLYNPYANFQNNVNQTSPIIPGADMVRKPEPVIIPQTNNVGKIILADTHLPRSYYDDILDNLELVSLNIVNDIKTLIKNQKNMKVNRFQSNILSNMKNSIKEQFYEVEQFREKEKLKILDEFKNSKSDIGNFLKDKFKPIQDILDTFRSNLKTDKREVSSKMGQIEEALYRENENVKKLLTNSKDPYLKYSAEHVYYPEKESELQFAIRLKQKYQNIPEEELIGLDSVLKLNKPKRPPRKKKEPKKEEEPKEEEKKEEPKEEPKPIQPIIIQAPPQEVVIVQEEEHPKEETEKEDTDEEEIEEEKEEEKEEEEEEESEESEKPKKKEKREKPRDFKTVAKAVVAAQKLIIIKRLKIYSRIREFNDSLLAIEEYVESLMESILAKPFENIEKYNVKIDIKKKFQRDKLDDFLKYITEALLIKTTQVKINRTFSFFFRRYIFQMDLVPTQFFSLFERRRLNYNPGKSLSQSEQEFVLIMKLILNTLVYDNLLSKADDQTNIGYNFKLIATVFYYRVILYYQKELPINDTEFNNKNDAFLAAQIDNYGSKVNDKHLKDELKKLEIIRKEELDEIIKFKEENAKNIVTYCPDTLPDEVEELRDLVLPFEEIELYLRTKTNFDLMANLLKWVKQVIKLMYSHHDGYND